MKTNYIRIKFGQLGILSRGVTYSPPEDLRRESDSTSIWLLRSTNLQGGEINLDDVTIVAAHCAKPSQRLVNGDLAICTANGSKALVGKASLVCLPNPSHYVVGAFCARMRPNDGESPEFLAALFESGFYKSWIGRLLAGTNINNLKPSDIASCSIRMPSSLSQRNRLGEIFSLSRFQIKTLNRLIAAKREQKRGLMQQLLTGKLRFPGFTEPWKTVRLGDVLKESRLLGTTGFTAKKITVKLYGRGVYAKQEKRTGSVNTRYFKRLSGQLIYSKLDFLNGAFGIVPDELDGFESTLDMPTFDIVSSANPHWLLALVGRRDFYQRFNDGAEGGRKAKRVDPSRFFDEVIQLPCRAEQDRIARLIIILGKEIELLEQQRAAFAAQRRGLMEKLLSGEIDIQNPKETAA